MVVKGMPAGRPGDYNEEIANAICARIADGESLRTICRDEGMPARGTVHRWLIANPEFQDQYERSRAYQADTLFDEILDIADDGSNDWMEKFDGEGGNIGWKENGEAIGRSRLRIDARKWMAGKMRPKKYSDKQDINLNHGVQDSLSDLLSEINGKSKGLPNA